MWGLQFLQGKGFLLGGTVLSVLSPVISVAFMGFAKGPSPPGKQMFWRKTAVWLSDTRWGCCKGNSSSTFHHSSSPSVRFPHSWRGWGQGPGSPWLSCWGKGSSLCSPLPDSQSHCCLSPWGTSPGKGVYEPVKLGFCAFVDFSGISARKCSLNGFSK